MTTLFFPRRLSIETTDMVFATSLLLALTEFKIKKIYNFIDKKVKKTL